MGAAAMLAVALSASAPTAPGPDPLAACEAAVRQKPNDYRAYVCFQNLTHSGRRHDAEDVLQRLLARDPDNPLLQTYLGGSYSERGAPAAADLLRKAAAGFARVGNPWGETDARMKLANLLCIEEGRCDEADAEVRRAAQTAAASSNPEVGFMVKVWSARLALDRHDIGSGERLALEARDMVVPDGPVWAQWRAIDMVGYLEWVKWNYPAALETKRRAAALIAGDKYLYASSMGSVAQVAVRLWGLGEMSTEEATRIVREALAAQEAAGSEGTSGAVGSLAEQVRLLLALLLGPTDAGMAEVEKTVEINRRNPLGSYPYPALWLMAEYTLARDPNAIGPALELVDEALSLSRRRGRRLDTANGLLIRGHLELLAGMRAPGMQDELQALELIDDLRALQPDGRIRAEVGGTTAFAYRLVAGYLLDPDRAGQDLPQAFAVMERLRARVLDDVLSRANAPSIELPTGLVQRRTQLVASLNRIQKRLMDPELGAAERRDAEAELARAEQTEAVLRDEIARVIASRQSPTRGTVPTLAEVQGSLADDEALLLFQTWRPEHSWGAPFEDGSSWLMVVTRSAATARRIPDAQVLEPQVAQWNSLLQRRDGSDAPGAQRLSQDLLGDALARLPATVDHLWVAGDGPLHQLAWEALRSSAVEAPLGARYRISVIPSATIWRRWRTAPVQLAAVGLVVGDPTLVTPAGKERALGPGGMVLTRLPRARQEATGVADRLGPGSELLLGEQATERRVKTANLEKFSLLHFATHALVDEANPERSAVVLAPGSDEEDGLLQVREITALRLAPCAVVLAACSTSSGRVVQGEGVLGLARAFFEAGARVVVGTRWPVRDDASEQLFDGFYRRLPGRSVSEAMLEARRERIRAGAPAADWAALVVLGDGGVRLPAPGLLAGRWVWLGAGLLGVVLLGSVLVVRRQRRGTLGSASPSSR